METTRSRSGTRAPRGVVTKEPIFVRLLPAELHEFNALVVKEQTSEGALGRRLLLRGLKAVNDGESI